MPNSGTKVVLVEDDDDDIYLFKQSIRLEPRIDQDVTIYHSINELFSNETHYCDVLVLDLGLPDSQGLKTIVTVSNYLPDIPIIVLTGTDSSEVGEQAIQLGAQDYIPKAELCQSLISRSIRFSIERHSLVLKMRNMAHVDPLTLLYNRAYFMERLEQQISIADRNKDSFAVMMIDLDGFKDVNDTLGHNAGDQVLSQFAARMRSKTRQADLLARLGGDEFVVLLSAVSSESDCIQSAENKLMCCESPFLVFSHDSVHKVDLGMSIGLAVFPNDGVSPKSLIEHADEAMYSVKNQGKNGYKLYSNLQDDVS